MKKYSFRLESVRRVRRLQEEAAKAVLAAANRDVQLAQERIDAALLHYAEVSNGHVQAGGAEAFLSHRFMVEIAGRGVVETRQAKAAAELLAHEAHGAWSECARALKALDRLDEKARDEYRIEFDRDVDAQMDEINVGRHGRAVVA